jgi:hypothetical protein
LSAVIASVSVIEYCRAGGTFATNGSVHGGITRKSIVTSSCTETEAGNRLEAVSCWRAGGCADVSVPVRPNWPTLAEAAPRLKAWSLESTSRPPSIDTERSWLAYWPVPLPPTLSSVAASAASRSRSRSSTPVF